MWHVTGSVSASHCSRKQNLVSSCRRVAQRVHSTDQLQESECHFVKWNQPWIGTVAWPFLAFVSSTEESTSGNYRCQRNFATVFTIFMEGAYSAFSSLPLSELQIYVLTIKQGTSRLVETFSNYCGNYLEISLTSLMSTMRGGEWRLSSFVISPIDLGEAGRCLALVAMWSSHNVVVLENRPNSLYNLSKYNVQVSQWNISIVLSRKVPNSKPQFTI